MDIHKLVSNILHFIYHTFFSVFHCCEEIIKGCFYFLRLALTMNIQMVDGQEIMPFGMNQSTKNNVITFLQSRIVYLYCGCFLCHQ